MKPTMETDAILAEFSASRRKQDAVIQLAQKNGCSYEEMRGFLLEHGNPDAVKRLPKSAQSRKRRAAEPKPKDRTDIAVQEIEQRYQETVRKQLDDIRQLRSENATLAARTANAEKAAAGMEAEHQKQQITIDGQREELRRLSDMLEQLRQDFPPQPECPAPAASELPEVQRLKNAIVNMALAIYGG